MPSVSFLHTEGIQIVQGLDQLQCRFFSDTGHTGDIVGGISHQCLHINELHRGDTVLFCKQSRIVDNVFFGFHQNHTGVFRDQLQGVPVSGQQIDFHIRFFPHTGKSTEYVVRFIAGAFYDGESKGGGGFFGVRKLHGKLFRHSFPGGFITVVGFVTEGRFSGIKSTGQMGGCDGGHVLVEDIHKSEDGIGRKPCGSGKIPDPVERPVQDAVAVQNKKFLFHTIPHTVYIWVLYHKKYTSARPA